MSRIKLLPYWVLPDTLPSVYDMQSGTALEMVAKVYGAMRNLQTDYNKFVNEINTCITEFNKGIIEDQKTFKDEINKIIHDYIIMIDSKIAHQDRVIEENITYIKENLTAGITQIINDMRESGEFDEAILNGFDELATKVDNIEINISSLAEEIGTNKENIQNLSTEVTNLDNRITNVENKTKSIGYEYNPDTETLNIVYREE